MKGSLNFTGQAEYAEEFIKFENPPAPRVLTNPMVWREAFRLHDGGQAKSKKAHACMHKHGLFVQKQILPKKLKCECVRKLGFAPVPILNDLLFRCEASRTT